MEQIYLFCIMNYASAEISSSSHCLYLRIAAAVAIIFASIGQSFGVGFAPVRNFSRQQYGAGSQNWAVTQDPSGRMYFANGTGLLKFDGERWSLTSLPNYTTVRAVFADDKTGRIYVGGSGEFGYFHTDPGTRRMSYVSMVGLLPERERDFTEIWNIHEIEEGRIAFQGDYCIFICDDESSLIIWTRSKLTASGLIDGRLYAGTQDGVLMVAQGERLTKVARTPIESRIVGILPYHTHTPLIVTAGEGLFTLEDGSLKELVWDITPFLKANQTFSATYSEGSFAFGTVSDGAVVKNLTTGKTTYINKTTGLQNNTVLNLGFDFTANLWLCLDNGLSYAMVDSPVFNLLGSDSDSGAGYASMRGAGNLYLATNRGLFSTPYPFADSKNPPSLSRMLGGQIWGLDSIGSDIFVSADDGLYIMADRQGAVPKKVEGIGSGSWYVAPLKSRPGKALASTYSGFYLLSHEGGAWHSEGKIDGYDDAGGKFVEDREGNIWLAHWIKGIYKLTLSPDLDSFTNVRLYTSKDGLPNERDNSLAIYHGKLRIGTASGEFFKPNPDGTLSRDEVLTRLIPLKFPAHFYPLPSGMSFAFSPRLVWKMTRDTQGKTSIDSVSLRMVANSLIPGFEHVGFIDEGTMIVSHQEGFYSINLGSKQSDKWKNGVFVESLLSGDSIIFSGLQRGEVPDIRLPFNLNSLTFNFAAPEYRYQGAILYSCKLEDYDKEWSAPSETPSKEYTRLGEGRYTLRLRALNTITGETSESALEFEILPPWYRSIWAMIVYALLLVLLIFGIYAFLKYLSLRNAKKIREQKEAGMELMRREAEKEALRKDYEIAALKSDQLELDIKHKSSELSNTAMNVIRKNEILLDISSMLNQLHEKADAEGKASQSMKKEVDKIQNLIRENISHDDDWKKFNQNFDIVYADFTKRLSELHPDLTLAERRLCCYLKMGLSSKEIAPIFSISPKSVEMNRYRLRKKMGLEREANLVEYLQSI